MPFISSVRGSFGAQGRAGKRSFKGELQSNPANSAREILSINPSAPSGIYWINDGTETFEVYCDMTRNGGGWMLVASIRGGNGNEVMNEGAAGVAIPQYQPSSTSNWGKFSDARINRIRSRSQTTANGYTGNWPWWVEGTGGWSEGTYASNINSSYGGTINMFIYKDAQSFSSRAYISNHPECGSPYSSGPRKQEFGRIRNTYDENSTSYVYVSNGDTDPNCGTRGFGHHHQPTQPDYTNPRFSWCRHPEGGGSCAMRADPWGIPTYGHLWVK